MEVILDCCRIEIKEKDITKQELLNAITEQLQGYKDECVFETVFISGFVKAEEKYSTDSQ